MLCASEPLVVTVVFGTFHQYLKGWVKNLRSVGCHSTIHIIALDDIEFPHDTHGIVIHRCRTPNLSRWSGDYVRLDLIKELCAKGHTCVQADLDIFFNENPILYCNIPYDFIISRGLGFPKEAVRRWGFSVCTGFYIIKPGAHELVDAWLALRQYRNGLDQENLNLKLLEDDLSWRHECSAWVRDTLLVSHDSRICVLPDRAVTRDCTFDSFGAVHSQSMLAQHL